MYDTDQKPQFSLTSTRLHRHVSLFENVTEIRIQTYTSRDDPVLARFLSLLPALHTLQMDYYATGRTEDDPSAKSEMSSESDEAFDGGGKSGERTPSGYTDPDDDARCDITSIMNTPFSKIRNLSLSNVFWDLEKTSSGAQDGWPSLENLSMLSVDAPPQGVARLLSKRSVQKRKDCSACYTRLTQQFRLQACQSLLDFYG